MKQNLALLVLLLTLAPILGRAAANPGEAATIDKVRIVGKAKPGAKVTASVDVHLAKGYHTHSNKPSEPIYIPTELEATVPEGVKLLTIKYPPGKVKKFKGLPKPLSIYEEEFSILVTVKLDPDTKLPLTIPAVLGYQACQDEVCYRPQKLKFEISIPAK